VTGREFDGDRDHPGSGLPPHDFDLLADYVGGALDSTAAGSDVATRIREDPAWRRAHTELTAASAAVVADLADWGRTPEPMPADVTARLTAALTDTGPVADSAPDTTTATEPVPAADPARRGRLSVVPGESTGRPRRRPLARWAAPLVAAAAVIAAVGFGLQALPGLTGASDDTASTSDGGSTALNSEADDAPAAAPADPAPAGEQARRSALADRPVRQLVASGADYRRQTLALMAGAKLPQFAAGSGPPDQDASKTPGLAAAEVPAALRRLAAPAALGACLAALGAGHPRPATSVDLVDYAAFEGTPALVVAFTDTAGEQWIYVAGPRCGLDPADGDTGYRAKVG
jgi:negative regulator of sigma E activity